MSSHHDHHHLENELHEQQGAVLKIVLAINLIMFIIEIIAGITADSTALLADALDMFGDALAYAVSLFVLTKNKKWKAGSAMTKGIVMLLLGSFVMGNAVYKIIYPVLPAASTITLIGILAFIANATCAFLLLRHRHDDINMHSVWLCSRNDLINGIAVIIAGVLVAFTHSMWPDIVVGIVISTLFLKTSLGIIFRSVKELKT